MRIIWTALLLTMSWAAFGANCGEASSHWRLRAQDVAYQAGPTPMRLDIYHPENQLALPFKTVVLIHGGCFMWGDKTAGDTMEYVQRLTNAGYAVVNVNYRLTNPETHRNQWPASMMDVQDAVRWVRQHGREYGLDTSKLVAMGYSAGATLAAYLGTRPINGSDGRVDGVIDFFGRTDFTHAYTHQYLSELGTGFPGEAKKDQGQPDCGEIYTGRAHGDGNGFELAQASVLSHVDSNSACTLNAHGTADTDVSVMHSELFHQQLLQASLKPEPEKRLCFPEVIIEGANHGWRDPKDDDKADVSATNQAWNAVCPFLAHVLESPRQEMAKRASEQR